MGGEVKFLWRLIRRPMLAWWSRAGLWWLAAILLAYLVNTVSYCLAIAQPPSASQVPLLGMLLPVALLATAAALHVAMVTSHQVSTVLTEQAVPEPSRLLRARYLLAYLVGLAPLAVAWVLELITDLVTELMMQHGRLLLPGESLGYWLHDTIEAASRPVLSDALLCVWLVALIVLVPKKTWLAWLLLLVSPVIGTALFFGITSILPSSYLAHPTINVTARSLLVPVSAALVIGMFLCFRHGRTRIAQALWLVLLAAEVLQTPLYWLGCYDRALAYAYYAVSGLVSFLGTLPVSWWAPSGMPPVDPPPSVLGFWPVVQPWFVLLLNFAWVPAMVALMYFVILKPRQPGPVDLKTLLQPEPEDGIL